MSLSGIPSRELARIDSICLQYEKALRRGIRPDIADLISRYDGAHAEVLQHELEMVRAELSASETSVKATGSKVVSASNLPEVGAQIGPYVVGETLGRGGMGVVVEAFDNRLERKVAIKLLALDIANKKGIADRFQREARAVAALSHPNIVELFDIGSHQGLPFAVMEFLDGQLLSDRLASSEHSMSVREVRRIGAQIADALATAHDAGVIHRDLKPENVMLVPRSGGGGSDVHDSNRLPDSMIVKLFDFGLSRAPHSEWTEGVDETQQGVVMGTPGYMSPEQAKGEHVTPAADVFSLGCVLFEAFYRRPAFDGATNIQRHKKTLECKPEPDTIRRRDDVLLAELIDRCLDADPSNRPQSTATIAEQLRQRDSGDAVQSYVDSGVAAGRFTRRRVMELVGGGLVGSFVGGILIGESPFGLKNIRSIAVLSIVDKTGLPNSDERSPEAALLSTASSLAATPIRIANQPLSPPEPMGDAELDEGEKLSALLVHELTRLSQVSVPRFRRIVGETPEKFREIANMLGVDALVTGDFTKSTTGTKQFLELDIQIISGRTGEQLWGKRFVKDAGESLLQQSELATMIASTIGQRLTSTLEEPAPPSVGSFACLVDAKVREDPDSLPGLERALMCYQMAHEEDPSFADAVAGIALTSITLAADCDPERSRQLILQARDNVREAKELDLYSIDGRLAEAMLDWQTTTVSRIGQAERTLQELAVVAPNNWQVHHQQGLLQLATGRLQEASKSLQEASQLNPLSVVLRVDRARLLWFDGNAERAKREAARIRDRYDGNKHARGLLVDIYEHLGLFDQAAGQHDAFNLNYGANDEEYFRERERHLAELPYGPFGSAINTAILRSRRGQMDETALADLIDFTPPMLPLILAAHPSFMELRSYPVAKEFLPA